MDETVSKTIMCSVLFLDIVEYSKRSVTGQISLKDRFNNHLSAAIRDVPLTDRIILDTGDGAAVNFLGDVEDALRVAISLRKSFLNEAPDADPPLLVRVGINLGPVRLVMDINGQPNVVGDGVNVAQRIMGFAEPNQILLSRSYYEAVSRLSPQYAGMFHYEGSRTDKHVREHEIYAIGQQGMGDKPAPETTGGQGAGQDGIEVARNTLQVASNQQRALYVAVFAAALALLAVVIVKTMYRPAVPLPQVAEAPKHTAQTASNVAVAPPKIVESKAENKQKAEQPPEEARLPARQEKIAAPISRSRTLKETTAIEPGAAALVSVAVMPWGEIYLDGRMQGVSPPLAELHVAPGKHEIEIRNTTFPVYTKKINVSAGEKIKIKHKFTD